MDDTNLDISINADSSGAVQAFDGLNNAVGGFGQKVETLGNTFAKPLEHVGVHIFGRELLSVIGLSGEARPIISLLQVAVNELGLAFNFAAGPMGLLIMGLGAAAAVIYKVVESHKAHAVALDDVAKKQQEQYSKTTDLITKIEEYKDKVGELTPVLNELEKATRAVNEEDKHSILVSEGKQLEAIDSTIRKKQELIDINNASIAANNREAAAFSGHLENGQLAVTINNELIKTNAGLTAEINKENKSRLEITANIHAQAKGYKDMSDQIEKQGKIASANATAEEKATEARLRNDEKAARDQKRLFDDVEKDRERIIRDRYNIEISGANTVFMQQAAMSENLKNAWQSSYASMAKGAGDAFSNMLIDGQSFGENMKSVFHNILKSFVSMLAEMAVRWAAMAALNAISGGAFSAAFSAARPMLTQSVFNVALTDMPGFELPAATGMDATFGSPTLLMVGEGGEDEHVTVTSRSQAQISAMGPGRNGGGDTYNMTFIANGNDDPRAFSEKVMAYISQQTRGRGQIRPVGPGIF